jgi:hypothetical protein
MNRKEHFINHITRATLLKGKYYLGGAILDGEALPDAHVKKH